MLVSSSNLWFTYHFYSVYLCMYKIHVLYISLHPTTFQMLPQVDWNILHRTAPSCLAMLTAYCHGHKILATYLERWSRDYSLFTLQTSLELNRQSVSSQTQISKPFTHTPLIISFLMGNSDCVSCGLCVHSCWSL